MIKKYTLKLLLTIIVWVCAKTNMLHAQVSILNAHLVPFNLSPSSLLDLTLSNPKGDAQVTIHAQLFGSKNELLLTVVSVPFIVKNGVNNTSQMGINVGSVTYAGSTTAQMLKYNHSLSSGKYTYCAKITGVDVNDDYCQELESENSAFLFLVSPPDKDELDSKYPTLVWTHNEPFPSLSGENYRLLITEISPGQSSEASINTNVPVYLKDLLSRHDIQYPIDAKELIPGHRYAWQVQKLNNGIIVEKTEAWEFKIKAPEPVKENKYAVVKKTLDGTIYTAESNKIFFRFDEAYNSKQMSYRIIEDNQKAITEQQSADNNGRIKLESVKAGYNTYSIDLNNYKIPNGIYLLEITNEKKEIFKLKFSIE